MDVEGRRYDSIADTLHYCYHVAGVVGLMMARVLGVKDEGLFDHACDLGLAFQLTNIARDLIEDHRNGRIYLPEQWLREEGVRPETMALPGPPSRAAPRCDAAACGRRALLRVGAAGHRCIALARPAWAIGTASASIAPSVIRCWRLALQPGTRGASCQPARRAVWRSPPASALFWRRRDRRLRGRKGSGHARSERANAPSVPHRRGIEEAEGNRPLAPLGRMVQLVRLIEAAEVAPRGTRRKGQR